MKDYIEARVLELTDYIIENNATVRKTASVFNISKSTVHKDIVERLPKISKSAAEKIREILDENKSQRHIRGGLATKVKYQKIKK